MLQMLTQGLWFLWPLAFWKDLSPRRAGAILVGGFFLAAVWRLLTQNVGAFWVVHRSTGAMAYDYMHVFLIDVAAGLGALACLAPALKQARWRQSELVVPVDHSADSATR